jgi:hypothetical protein
MNYGKADGYLRFDRLDIALKASLVEDALDYQHSQSLSATPMKVKTDEMVVFTAQSDEREEKASCDRIAPDARSAFSRDRGSSKNENYAFKLGSKSICTFIATQTDRFGARETAVSTPCGALPWVDQCLFKSIYP